MERLQPSLEAHSLHHTFAAQHAARIRTSRRTLVRDTGGAHGHTKQAHADSKEGTHPTSHENAHRSELAGEKLERTSSAMQLRIRSPSAIVCPMKYAPP